MSVARVFAMRALTNKYNEIMLKVGIIFDFSALFSSHMAVYAKTVTK